MINQRLDLFSNVEQDRAEATQAHHAKRFGETEALHKVGIDVADRLRRQPREQLTRNSDETFDRRRFGRNPCVHLNAALC